jgi:hypothetical protein
MHEAKKARYVGIQMNENEGDANREWCTDDRAESEE